MAREIMIVDSSASMRRILRTMIFANVNDAKIAESQNVNEAMGKLEQHRFHAVLFSKESSTDQWLDFIITNRRTSSDDKKPGFVLFTSSKHHAVVEEMKAFGVTECVTIPCKANELAEVVTKVCNPFVLRDARRYNLPDTTVVVEQGGERFHAEVVNFSEGGMLCEMDHSDKYMWQSPVMATINFMIDGEKEVASGLYSITTRLVVLESNPDFSPRRTKVAFKFEIIPEASSAVLNKVFDYVEKLEQKLGVE